MIHVVIPLGWLFLDKVNGIQMLNTQGEWGAYTVTACRAPAIRVAVWSN